MLRMACTAKRPHLIVQLIVVGEVLRDVVQVLAHIRHLLLLLRNPRYHLTVNFRLGTAPTQIACTPGTVSHATYINHITDTPPPSN